ncbi:hypothetical protein [Litorilituus sediminis]|uniref:VCBS repeat-containing protein n=1 Tax=Litorilituus sediminis TaxID=718192 RepID=A0A4P6PC01_9GAMM|nr:hypothetical protein [Litorilituus sediminis]QBG37265.1 hypothetical protein EMK97_16745 [Litorilituus sediminis]
MLIKNLKVYRQLYLALYGLTFCFYSSILCFFSIASYAEENVSPLIVKEIYEKDKSLCSSVIYSIKKTAAKNYQKLNTAQKEAMTLSYLTTHGVKNVLSIGKETILWSKKSVKFESLDGDEIREDEFIYADINNDGKSEFVVKLPDLTDVSDGFGWWVYPRFNPYIQEALSLLDAKQSVGFSYRDNNINISYSDTYQPVARNFHFEFITLNNHVYVLLMLHYGYSSVSQENVILADLNEKYQIKNQICHYELSLQK